MKETLFSPLKVFYQLHQIICPRFKNPSVRDRPRSSCHGILVDSTQRKDGKISTSDKEVVFSSGIVCLLVI